MARRGLLEGYGWKGDKLFVNSGTRIGRDNLDSWPLEPDGSIMRAKLAGFLGVNTGDLVLLHPVAVRDYVRDHYHPRGKTLSPSRAVEIVNGTITSSETCGIRWITASELDETLRDLPDKIRQERSRAGKTGGRPLGGTDSRAK